MIDIGYLLQEIRCSIVDNSTDQPIQMSDDELFDLYDYGISDDECKELT